MIYSPNDRVEAKPVTFIEGTPTHGIFFIKPMLEGERVSVLEVRLRQGVSSRPHSHSHESLIYIVSGSLKTVVGEEQFVLRQGDVCRHPENVMHSVEALEETVFIEIKAPVPALATVLGP